MLLVKKNPGIARILLGCTLLAGCESKAPVCKAPVTSVPTRNSHESAVTLSSVDTTTVYKSATGKQDKPSEDVPELHKLIIEKTKAVTPELTVTIKSIPPADTAIVREVSDISLVFTIKYNSKIIYRDTAHDGLMYDYYAMPQTEKLYPIWIPTGRSTGQLLVAFNNRPSKELARRFYISDGRVMKVDTMMTFNGPATDVDKDGLMEYAGFYDFWEVWDDEQGRRRVMYCPTLYYELRSTGLVLDSALTERKVKEEYGVFLGFQDSGNPGILYDKLPKGSPKR